MPSQQSRLLLPRYAFLNQVMSTIDLIAWPHKEYSWHHLGTRHCGPEEVLDWLVIAVLGPITPFCREGSVMSNHASTTRS